jgi:hypothetical protein
VENTQAISTMAKEMDKEHSITKTEVTIRATGKII